MEFRKFTPNDQAAFAELSGDYNPMHINALVARRLIYGSPVVHGIHTVLWALDAWLKNQTGYLNLHSIDIAFPKPLRVDEEARLSFTLVGEQHVKIEVISDETIVTKIDFKWNSSGQPHDSSFATGFPTKVEPCVLQLEEIDGKSGVLDLYFNSESAANMFPNLTKCASSLQIAVLLATTRLVGMECPGYHSVFFELNLAASNHDHKGTSLEYEVTKFDRRFGMIIMNLTAPGLSGVIQAFVRPTSQDQISYSKAKKLVIADEFSGQRALIVGGSRGLGEVSAKLLAAGGAEVMITYNQGRLEAHQIVDEITSHGGLAELLSVDVLSSSQNVFYESPIEWIPTHLYYFATPVISAGSKGVFSTKLFHKFCDYYITGFLNIINSPRCRNVKRVFHPSSIAVEEVPPDMVEYAAAKAAAELVCQNIKKARQPVVEIYCPRLLRMVTDQTVSLFPVNNEDPVPIMLNHLRVFRDL
jgi:NADP-dependent 3-hydroxy acid dehydrogenase YdfG